MQHEWQYRTCSTTLKTRAEPTEELVIEGYFAVFNSIYDMGCGMTESIAPGAFTDALNGDIRALIDHDSRLVLGRTTAGTLSLQQDDHGLYGKIVINPNDSDAKNLYERVKRGDVSQCSFGFCIEDEDTNVLEDGSIHWTIRKVHLFEVSCCTFPAYEDTAIAARKQDREAIRERKKTAWKASMREKLKGAGNPC